MSSIKVACRCGAVMVVPAERAGRAVGCPRCGQEVEVPEAEDASSSTAASPPPLPTQSAPPPTQSAPPLPTQSAPPPTPPRRPAAGEAGDAEPSAEPPPFAPPPPPPASSPSASPPADAAAGTSSGSGAAATSDKNRSPARQKKRWTEPPAAAPAAARSAKSDRATDDAAPPTPAAAPAAVEAEAAATAATTQPSSGGAADGAEAPPPTSPTSGTGDENLAAEVEPPPLPQLLPGLEPSPEGRRSALYLAVGVALIGLFSGLPAFIYLAQQLPHGTLAMPRWAAFLLMLSGLHLAYALYVAQLPDWSTVWVVAITMLAMATLNSLLLAATLLTRGDGGVVRLLELHDHVRGGRAAGWCFIMLCLSITAAYCAGRMAARWHSAETARLHALHLID